MQQQHIMRVKNVYGVGWNKYTKTVETHTPLKAKARPAYLLAWLSYLSPPKTASLAVVSA